MRVSIRNHKGFRAHVLRNEGGSDEAYVFGNNGVFRRGVDDASTTTHHRKHERTLSNKRESHHGTRVEARIEKGRPELKSAGLRNDDSGIEKEDVGKLFGGRGESEYFKGVVENTQNVHFHNTMPDTLDSHLFKRHVERLSGDTLKGRKKVAWHVSKGFRRRKEKRQGDVRMKIPRGRRVRADKFQRVHEKLLR